jgi:hypothetical protein
MAEASGVKANTLHKAIRAGRLPHAKKLSSPNPTPVLTQSQRSEIGPLEHRLGETMDHG